MNLRRATRRSRLKLAAVALAVTVAAVAALVIPGLAGAVDVPSITSPSDGDFLNGGWNQTVSFSSATSPAVGFSLLRNPATGGSCDMTGASTVGSAAPNATSIHDDSSPLPDARYCYVVEADDGAGVVADSAPINITYDTGPPIATIGTTPSAHSSDTTPTFSFSSSEPVGATFECSTDGGTYAACSSPKTLGSLSDGPHTFAVKAIDQAGNHSSSPDSFAWNVDTVPPTATIGTTPSANSSDATPTFSFSSSEPPGATFECSTDGGTYAACSSPKTLGSLSDGPHTFAVKAIDQAGNHSSSPDSFAWNVDTVHPTATIGTKPTSPSSDKTPGFSFSSSEPSGATFECSLDSPTYSSCSSPVTLPTLADGSHTFNVKAIDQAGNHSSSPASYTWIVDAAPPTATITTEPTLVTNDATPTFAFTSSEPTGATFECSIDGATLASCSTPKTYTTLADGSHTFAVKAIDLAGNHSPTAASYTWTIDATPPTALIVTNPGTISNDTTPDFTFSSSEPTGATFECSIDGAAYAACSTPKTLGALSNGSHTFAVKAIDTAANHSTVAASWTWTVDTVAPTVPATYQLIGPASRPDPPQFKFSAATDAHGPIVYRLLRDTVDTGIVASTCGSFLCATDSSIIADGSDDGIYHYAVTATDAAGNRSSTADIIVTIDGGPPSVPAGVRTPSALTRSAPVISWNASTGVPTSYRVFRGSDSIGTVNAPATTFSDVTLPLDGTKDGAYAYSVASIDAAGNQSAASSPVQIIFDSTHPLPASSLAVAQSPTAAKPVLIWPGSASNDVAGYNVYRGGTLITGAPLQATSYLDSGLDADGTYLYTVRAVDKAGNESADSQGASVLYDTTAPGTPGASAVAAPSGGTATVNWTPASDAGSGVAGYQVRRSAADGTSPTTLAQGTPVCGSVPPSAMGCADAGLTQGAGYRYSVFAIDAVGNVSLAGKAAGISIPSTLDKTPPNAVSALHAVVANGQISLKWKNPTADLATVSVIWNSKRAPRSSRDGNLVYRGTGAKVTLKVPNLSAGKQMRFAVFAADKVGNVSPAARATIIVPRPSQVSLAPHGKLSGNPNLTWNAVTGATYYNVQVFEGTQAAKRVSISWPAVTKYTLQGNTMKKGKTYTWYVWPGIGRKSAAKYGKLIGKVTFVYTG